MSSPRRCAGTVTLPNKPDSVKFAAFGDMGTGDRPQYEVADRMWEARGLYPYEFVIMLGDNIYGSDRPADYQRKFELPYKRLLDAGVKFYAALGNHDSPSQRFYRLYNMDGERYYSYSKGPVQFFALDSTYMDRVQLDWIDRELGASTAHWKIAYFHHPLYSSGARHGSELDLRAVLEPLFVKHGVDAVFAGHEHFYERVTVQKGIHYFISGAGGKLRRGNIRKASPTLAAGYDLDRSFMLIEIEGDELHFQTISRQGETVDHGTLPRPADPSAAATAPSR
jgi:predicted phosphodiesterase